MKALTISKYLGLDSRREDLTSQPGTLLTLQDAFVNAGGECQKRKAFFEIGLLDVDATDGSGACFGLEVTEIGLLTFGSPLPYGTTPSQGQPVVSVDITTLLGVNYQQLKHPTLTNDSSITYNDSYHRLTEIRFSKNYNGKAFVAAVFTDSNTFLYYDGVLVQQSVNGLVLEGRTSLADIGDDLVRQLIAINWNAEANYAGDSVVVASITRAAQVATVTTKVAHGYTTADIVEIVGAVQNEYNGKFAVTVTSATQFTYTLIGSPDATATTLTALLAIKDSVAQNGAVIVKSPSGDSFAPDIVDTSTAGYVGIKTIGTKQESTNGVKAFAGFQITVNSGTFTLEAPAQKASATPVIDLCGGAVTAGATATATATAIANAVNDLTFAHGYSALTNVDVVFIYAPIEYGVFAFNLTVTPTTGTVVSSVATPTGPVLTLTPNPLSVSKRSIATTTIVSGGCVITAGGGTAPYSYLWQEVEAGSGNGITISNGTTSTAYFSSPPLTRGQRVSGSFKVTVTDSAAIPGISVAFLTVVLEHSPLI